MPPTPTVMASSRLARCHLPAARHNPCVRTETPRHCAPWGDGGGATILANLRRPHDDSPSPTSWHAAQRSAIPCRVLRSYPNLRRPHGAARHGVTTGRHDPRAPTQAPRRSAPWGDDRAPRSLCTHADPTTIRPQRHGIEPSGEVPSPCGSPRSLCTHGDPTALRAMG
jgi:hypothetical protein